MFERRVVPLATCVWFVAFARKMQSNSLTADRRVFNSCLKKRVKSKMYERVVTCAAVCYIYCYS